MRLQTKHLWDDFWRSLNFDQHAWQNQSEFREWFQDQGEVDAGSNETWITKEQDDELWGPDNSIATSHSILQFCARVPARRPELGPGSPSSSGHASQTCDCSA